MLFRSPLYQEEESEIGRGRDETSESKRVATQVNTTVHLHPTHFPLISRVPLGVFVSGFIKIRSQWCVRGLCFSTALAKSCAA